MNEKQIAMLRAMIDIAWTTTVLGIIAYAGRRHIVAFITAKRAELDARAAAVHERADDLKRRAEFARHDRERIIAEEFDVIARNDNA